MRTSAARHQGVKRAAQGYPLVLMSPLHFIAKPTRWLEFMARHGTSHTVAPDFALGLATKCALGFEVRFMGLAPRAHMCYRALRACRGSAAVSCGSWLLAFPCAGRWL